MVELGPVLAGDLERALHDRDLGSGGQVWVSHRGAVVADVAVGTTHVDPMTPDTVHGCWCITKPVVALAVAAEVERAGHGTSASFGDLGVEHPCAEVRNARVTDALAHLTAFGRPTLMEARMHLAAERADLLRRVGWQPFALVDGPAYSEWVTGALLEQVLGALAVEPGAVVLQRALDDSGLAIGLAPSGPTLGAPVGCLRWLDAGRPGHHPPLLHDLAMPHPDQRSPALGGIASMRGIGGWYALVSRALGEGVAPRLIPSPDRLAACLAVRRAAAPDPVLRRSVAFAAGFMVDLAGAGFGPRVGPRALGHVGWSGGSWAFLDPDIDLVVAAMVNGATADHGRFDRWRADLVDIVYQMVGR